MIKQKVRLLLLLLSLSSCFVPNYYRHLLRVPQSLSVCLSLFFFFFSLSLSLSLSVSLSLPSSSSSSSSSSLSVCLCLSLSVWPAVGLSSSSSSLSVCLCLSLSLCMSVRLTVCLLPSILCFIGKLSLPAILLWTQLGICTVSVADNAPKEKVGQVYGALLSTERCTIIKSLRFSRRTRTWSILSDFSTTDTFPHTHATNDTVLTNPVLYGQHFFWHSGRRGNRGLPLNCKRPTEQDGVKIASVLHAQSRE